MTEILKPGTKIQFIEFEKSSEIIYGEIIKQHDNIWYKVKVYNPENLCGLGREFYCRHIYYYSKIEITKPICKLNRKRDNEKISQQKVN